MYKHIQVVETANTHCLPMVEWFIVMYSQQGVLYRKWTSNYNEKWRGLKASQENKEMIMTILNKVVVVSRFQPCEPMDCSTLGSGIFLYFPEFTQIHVLSQ